MPLKRIHCFKTAPVHVGYGKLLWQQWPSNLPHRGGLSNLPHRGGLCRYVSSASRADITGNEEVSSLAPDLFMPQMPPVMF